MLAVEARFELSLQTSSLMCALYEESSHRRVKVDQAGGLCHRRNFRFCRLSVGTVAFHCTMICVIEIIWTPFILFGID